MTERARISEELLRIAARRSVETAFGWTHPDCVLLQEAARLVRGDPPPKTSTDAVLSQDRGSR